MPYYLSYIIYTEPGRRIGHASLGISECTGDGPVRMIFRIGLFRPSQVQLEDFSYIDKPGRRFFHKTYQISKVEMEKFFLVVNGDRRLPTSASLERSDAGTHITHREGLRQEDKTTGSTPSGPEHNYVSFNCKTYVLRVMDRIGIHDSQLRNFGIDMPKFSGRMQPLELVNDDETDKILIWKSPLVISKRHNNKTIKLENMTSTLLLKITKRAIQIYQEVNDLSPSKKARTAFGRIFGIDALGRATNLLSLLVKSDDKSPKGLFAHIYHFFETNKGAWSSHSFNTILARELSEYSNLPFEEWDSRLSPLADEDQKEMEAKESKPASSEEEEKHERKTHDFESLELPTWKKD